MRLLFSIAILCLSACTPEGLPENRSDTAISDLPVPEIAPLYSLLQMAETDLPASADPDPDLAQRGAALRARADAIREAAP